MKSLLPDISVSTFALEYRNLGRPCLLFEREHHILDIVEVISLAVVPEAWVKLSQKLEGSKIFASAVRLAIVVVEIPGAATMLTETEIGGFQDTRTLADRPLEYQPASTIFQQVSRFLTLFSSREGRIEAIARLTQTSINFFDRGPFSAKA
jgi:hypothetical protein